MRVFKPTYSVPIPDGAKRLRRKDGTYYKFERGGKESIAKVTRNGKRVSMESNCYYVEFQDHLDIQRRLKAFTGRAASNRLAATVEDILNAKGSGQGVGDDLRRRIEALPKSARARLAEWGVLDDRSLTAAKPLPELIEKYREHLVGKACAKLHITKTACALYTVFGACGFKSFSDIDSDQICNYLSSRRDAGLSFCRSNALLMACKCFAGWMAECGYVNESPLRGNKAEFLDVKKDRRYVRRAITIDELKRLFQVAEESTATYEGLTGQERALLFRLAASTGIRRGELRELTVGDFDLTGGKVTVPASAAKNGKARTIQLAPDMVARLRQCFASKLPIAKALKVPYNTARCLQRDMAVAGIPIRDSRGHVFDFHSLRGMCATMLIESGVEPKVAKDILGHADIRLTLDLYAKTLDKKTKEREAAAALSRMMAG
jgi:integrase